MSTRELDEREIISLLQMYDHRPAGREHDDLRQAYYKAVCNMLDLSWFGHARVYLSKRLWCVDDGGLWVEHEKHRVRVGSWHVSHRQKCGHVTLMAKPDFAEVVYVLSSGHEYLEGVMRLPVGKTPAEFTPSEEP